MIEVIECVRKLESSIKEQFNPKSEALGQMLKEIETELEKDDLDALRSINHMRNKLVNSNETDDKVDMEEFKKQCYFINQQIKKWK